MKSQLQRMVQELNSIIDRLPDDESLNPPEKPTLVVGLGSEFNVKFKSLVGFRYQASFLICNRDIHSPDDISPPATGPETSWRPVGIFFTAEAKPRVRLLAISPLGIKTEWGEWSDPLPEETPATT